MKKILTVLVALILALSCGVFAACDKEDEGLLLAVPDGAPMLAAYNLMKQTEIEGKTLKIKVVGGNENIGNVVSSGEADFAVMPTNAAAKLYNKGIDIKLATVNVFGVLYMVGKNSIESLSELKGQIVCCTARGGTPDVTLRMILSENNIEYFDYNETEQTDSTKVAIKYVTEGSDVIAQLKTSQVTNVNFGVLGEPAVTQACKATESQIVVDFQAEMNKILGENSFTQAGVVFASSVYNNKTVADKIISLLEENKATLLAEVDLIGTKLQEKGSTLKVTFNADIINRSNIDSKMAVDIKTNLTDYFKKIEAYDSTFIGKKLPDDNFYYQNN